MKKKRQNLIKEIISRNSVSTQEELLSYLEKNNMTVTQATVSRDISEMNLIKVRDDNNRLVYSLPTENPPVSVQSSVLHTDHAGNTVVIRCRSGMASALCAEIDARHYPDVVGTIAGDDTIFILLRSEELAAEFIKRNFGER
jgi:transcriptional regulator of arginine metabolism